MIVDAHPQEETNVQIGYDHGVTFCSATELILHAFEIYGRQLMRRRRLRKPHGEKRIAARRWQILTAVSGAMGYSKRQ